MPRTQITLNSGVGYGDWLAADLTWTSADQANGMYFNNDGNTVLIVWNGDAASKTVTIAGVANSRTFNAAPSNAATVGANDEFNIAGFFDTKAFNQTDGSVNVDFSADTSVKIAAVKLGKTPY